MDDTIRPSGALRVSGLDLSVAGRLLLRGVNLRLDMQERVGLTGPSGIGKSTLLRAAVAGALPHGSHWEEFFVQGGGVGYAPQAGGLLPWYSVRRNLQFFRDRRYQDIANSNGISEVAEGFGLAGILESFPYQISGGERQRVVLACVALLNPSLFIIDEPLTGVDTRMKWSCLEELSRRVASCTAAVLVVSHDVDVLSYLCDRVVVLGDVPGRVVQEFNIDYPQPRSRAHLVDSPISEARTAILKWLLTN